MRPLRSIGTLLALVVVLFAAAAPAWAAQCTDVFSTSNGINSNRQVSGNTLDLTGIPFANNPWPASGTTLSSGDYYYGSANLGNGYELNVAAGARVRIFINGSQSFGNNVDINADGDPEQFLLVTSGSLTLGNNAEINGLLYAAGSIGVGNGAEITGGLAAGGGISIGNNRRLGTDYGGVEQGLLAGLCEGPVDLSANGDSVGPVTVEVGETVLLSVRGEACPAPDFFFQYQEWDDFWLVDNGLVQSSTSFDSLCDRSPVNRSVTFDEPGDYLVRFESVYRDCVFLFGCGGSQTFGQDEIVISVTDPVGQQVDHFEIIHDGVALTCQPETVQIRACANADCSEPFTDPVQATLAPANGWLGGNVVSLINGFGEATLQITTAGTAVLDVVGSTPSTRAPAVTLCQVGGSLSAENCELQFFDAGLAFEVPDLISHRPSGPIQVRAVRQDEQSQQCVPAFGNQTRTVEFWSDYVDPGPAGRAVSRPVSVNGANVSGEAAALTGIELAFDADGVAEMAVTYPDAGLVQLTARYVGSEATEDAGLVMPGADDFVSIPAGFCVNSAGVCEAGDASCPIFVRAGETFALSVTAAGWQSDGDADVCQGNPNTPNFRLLDIPVSAELVAPAGGETGEVSPASYSHGRAPDASAAITVQHSEVGVFRFLTTPAEGAYFGRDLPVGRSAPIGRFYPDRFRVNVDPGELAAVCEPGSFTYTGQSFDWLMPPSALIEPLSVQGNRTRNYTSPGFRRLAATDVARTEPSADALAVTSDGDPIAVTVNQQPGTLTTVEPGLMQFDYSADDAFRYLKSAATRIDPFFPELPFALSGINDADGVQAEAAPYIYRPAAAFDVRYGRLVLENVYGPETVDELQMPFRTEFFRDGGFELNVTDACSAWSTADIDNTGNHHALTADAGAFNDGIAGPLRLVPNGSQGTDTLVWQVEQWLQDDWTGDGALELPSATATFGVYRGHDRVIYWRQVP